MTFEKIMLALGCMLSLFIAGMVYGTVDQQTYCVQKAITLDLATYDKFGKEIIWKDKNAKLLCEGKK